MIQEKHEPITPANIEKQIYNVPMSLWFVEHNHLKKGDIDASTHNEFNFVSKILKTELYAENKNDKRKFKKSPKVFIRIY